MLIIIKAPCVEDLQAHKDDNDNGRWHRLPVIASRAPAPLLFPSYSILYHFIPTYILHLEEQRIKKCFKYLLFPFKPGAEPLKEKKTSKNVRNIIISYLMCLR